jgi:hypothetical protein
MPRPSVWFVRLSLIYLASGFTLGALLLWNKGLPFYPPLWLTLQAHIEFLVFGWLVQLIMGVAFWIAPRFSQPPRHGRVWLAWLAFGLLNAGILVAGVLPLFVSAVWMRPLGWALEVLAAASFAVYLWPRLKPAGAP